MSVLNWILDEHRVQIVCDTLKCDAIEKLPVGMTTKVFAAPHMGALIGGTGLQSLTTRFYVYASESNVPMMDVVELDHIAPAVLGAIFPSVATAPLATTATVYTFGWSRSEARFVGFVYPSTNNFVSKRMPYGLCVKPPPADISGLDAIDTVEQLAALVHVQKAEDRAKPQTDRVCIGGDIVAYEMMRDGQGRLQTTIRHVERFEDFESDWAIAMSRMA